MSWKEALEGEDDTVAAEITKVEEVLAGATTGIVVSCAVDALMALGLSKRDVLGEVFDYLESLP